MPGSCSAGQEDWRHWPRDPAAAASVQRAWVSWTAPMQVVAQATCERQRARRRKLGGKVERGREGRKEGRREKGVGEKERSKKRNEPGIS